MRISTWPLRPLRPARLLATVALLTLPLAALAQTQNVGIGTTTPNSKAALDITAADKGLLVPRLTNLQRRAITTPPQGLLVFQTGPDSVGFWYATGTNGKWLFLPDKASAGDNLGNHTATQKLDLGANQLVGNGGATGMAIDNTGNVGLGTMAPAAKLHVVGNTTLNGSLGIGTNSITYPLTITGSTTTAAGFNSSSPTGARVLLSNNSTGGSNWYLNSTGSGNTDGAGKFVVADINNTTRLAVTSTGQLGVNTGSPTATLDVNGTTRLRGLTTAGLVTTDANGNLTSSTSLPAGVTGDNLGNHTATQSLDLGANALVGNGGTTGIAITSGGNVGIGAAAGTFKLLVSGGDTRLAATGGQQALFGLDRLVGFDDLRFYGDNVGSTELMRLQSNGNLGLGTTAPGYRLHVVGGDTRIAATGGQQALFGLDRLVGFDDLRFYADDAGAAELMRLQSNGRLGVGTASPTATLDVNGTTRLRGLTTAGIVTTDASGNLSSATAASLDATTASNGLTKTGNDIALGGTLSGATTVALNGNNFGFTGTGNIGIASTAINSRLSISSNSTEAKITLYDGGDASNHYGLGVSSNQLNYHVRSAGASHVFYAAGKNGDGTELLRIMGTGNVGIGTTSPSYKLDVSGTLRATGNAYLGGNVGIGTTSPLATLHVASSAFYVQQLSSSNTAGTWLNMVNSSTGGTDWHLISTGSANSEGAGRLVIGTPTLRAVTIDGAGNTGIGTASPTEKLHVEAGNIFINGEGQGLIVDSQGAKRIGMMKYTGREAGIWRTIDPNNLFEIGRVQGVTSLPGTPTGYLTDIAVTNDGYVGIGTSAPATQLHVTGTAGTPNVRLESLAGSGTRVVTADASGNLSSVTTASLADNLGNHNATTAISLNDNDIYLRGTSGSDPYHGLGYYGPAKLWNGTTVDGPVLYGFTRGVLGINAGGTQSSVLTWNSAGNVGIGTTTPTERLDVAGNTNVTGNTTVTGSSYVSGNVGIGTTSAPLPLTVQGTGTTSELVQYRNSSGTDKWHWNLNGGGLNLSESNVGDGRLFVKDGGQVGINTQTPSAQLDVNGTTRLRGLTTAGVVTTDASGNLSSATAASLDATTASNGLTKTGTDIALGGTLASATTIGTTAANSLTVNGAGTVNLGTGTGAVNVGNATGATAISGSSIGLTGTTNINTSSTAATNIGTGASAGTVTVGRASGTTNLNGTVTMGSLTGGSTRMVTASATGVLSTAAVPTGESTTASNGLTLTGTNITLGGTLTGATTIAQANNFLALTGGGVGIGAASASNGARTTIQTSTAAETGLYVSLTGASTAHSLKLEHNGSNFIVRPATAGGTSTVVENTGGGALLVNPSGGNVGIGTTSTTAKLHVGGTVAIDGANTLEFGAGVSGKEVNAGKIGYNVFGSNALDIVGAGTTNANRQVKIWSEGGTTITGLAGTGTRIVTADLNGSLGSATAASLDATTASNGLTKTGTDIALGGTLTGATTVNTAGFGLSLSGTTSNILSTTSSSTTGTWLNMTNSTTGGAQWSLISTGSGNGEGAGRLLIRDHTNGVVRVTFDPSGNVGIGTTNPSAKLEVSNGTVGLAVRPGYYYNGVAMVTDNNYANLDLPGTKTLNVSDNVTISDGALGVGSATAPSAYKLQVTGGNTRIAAVGGEQSLFGVDQIVGFNDLRFYTDDAGTTERMRLDGSGNLGIGTTAPAAKLDVDGSFQLGTNGTTLAAVIKATVNKDLPNITGGNGSAQTFAVANAATGATVYVSPASALTAGLMIQYARVSAAGTVEVMFYNSSGSPINMAAMDFYITVIQ